MALFRYKALNAHGELFEGQMDAASEAEVAARLRRSERLRLGGAGRPGRALIASALASQNEVPIDAALPATMPNSSADQCRISKRRCCQIGTAKATVTGPSTSISQWVLLEYSA